MLAGDSNSLKKAGMLKHTSRIAGIARMKPKKTWLCGLIGSFDQNGRSKGVFDDIGIV